MKRNVKMYSQFINEDLLPGGAADIMKESDFDPNELALGIKDEMEHTSDPKLAKEIAMYHLSKYPNYYSNHEVNEKIVHQGDRWLVFTKDGKKLLGSHESRKDARDQLAAIEISKNKG